MKTTKLFILLLCTLLTNYLNAQTVILDVMTVNGQSVSATAAINFGTNTSITVGLFTQVSLPSAPNDNSPGTIKIIYQKNINSTPIVATNGNGGNLIFMGSSVAGRNFSVVLPSSQFDNTGGIIYAEYQTFTGVKYKSPNKSIIKSTTTSPPVSPTNPSNNNYAKESVPYLGIPLLPNLQPDYTSYDGTNNEFRWVYADEVFDKIFTTNGRGSGMVTSSIKLIPQQKITRNSGLIEYFTYPKSYTFYVNVDPLFVAGRILVYNNTINEDIDLYIPLGQNSPTLTGTPPTTSTNLTILGYQWQRRDALRNPNFSESISGSIYSWENIVNATNLTYTPEYSIKPMEYRRLAITTYARISSNVISVFPVILPTYESICCNQIIYTNSTINTIIGEATITDNNYTYQWQEGRDLYGNGNIFWTNIKDANSKDYLPKRKYSGGNNRPIYGVFLYRRIIIRNTDKLYFLSNNINVDFRSTANRIANQNLENFEENSLSIFPNPTSSLINVVGMDISSCSINISDMSGRTLISKPSGYYKDIQQIDITNLPVGVYSLNLENSMIKVSKKIIKK